MREFEFNAQRRRHTRERSHGDGGSASFDVDDFEARQAGHLAYVSLREPAI